VPPLAAAAVRALGTLRITDQGAEALEPLWAERRPLIYAVWHGRILMVPWLNVRLRRTRGARLARVLASRSRDGELVARWVQRFGLAVVRGSSSRGGAEALRALAAAVQAGEDVVVPDGPRGRPACAARRGGAGRADRRAGGAVRLLRIRPPTALVDLSWCRCRSPGPPWCSALPQWCAPGGPETARIDLERTLQGTERADRLVGA
jgi:lysophospholipid acyltransferase (LPLAT)-like uncharacterized protein